MQHTARHTATLLTIVHTHNIPYNKYITAHNHEEDTSDTTLPKLANMRQFRPQTPSRPQTPVLRRPASTMSMRSNRMGDISPLRRPQTPLGNRETYQGTISVGVRVKPSTTKPTGPPLHNCSSQTIASRRISATSPSTMSTRQDAQTEMFSSRRSETW